MRLQDLPLDVQLRCLEYLGGRDLAAVQVASRALQEAATHKSLWRSVLWQDFHARVAPRALFPQGADARGTYVQRVTRTAQRRLHHSTSTLAQKAVIAAFDRRLRFAKGLMYFIATPTHIALMWAPFLFLLFLALRLDEKIKWSWWAVFAPAYCAMYLFVVCSLGACCVRAVDSDRARLFNSTAFSLFSFSKALSVRVCDQYRRVITLAMGETMIACLGTWFVTLALKLEGQWAVSWVTASFPLWLAFGFGLLYSCGTLTIRKPSHGMVVVAWMVGTLTLVPPLLSRADGKHIKLLHLFIPEWIAYGSGIFASILYCCHRTLKCLPLRCRGRRMVWRRLRPRKLGKGCGVFLGMSMAAACFVTPLALLSTNEKGVSHQPYSTVYALPLVLLAAFAAFMCLLQALFTRRYGLSFNRPDGVTAPSPADVFRSGNAPSLATSAV